MFKNLNTYAIGIRNLSLAETIELAGQTGFAGVDFNIREAAALADAHGVEYVRALFARANVIPGQWGLPVDWRSDERWQQELDELPRLAALGRELGCLRTATWVLSWSDERPFAQNYAWHAARFRPIAQALKEQGCRLGLEFLGPQTLRTQHPHAFIYTLEGMMELAGDIGTGNVGLLLDAWHLYTSGGSIDDLDRITAADIVTVHINDAPAGIARDEQIDNVRCLPLETGVIDLPGFMGKLAALGYDGPITTEPFNKPINSIAGQNPQRAARLVSEAMDRLWQASGLT